MTSHVPALARSAGLALVLVSACTAALPAASGDPSQPSGDPSTGHPGTETPAATLSWTPTASPTPGEPSPPTGPGASPSPSLEPAGEPPAALLAGADGGPAAGDLGTFSWDGLVSDAPWIVGSAAGRTSVDATLTVTFDPGQPVVSWRARWAAVADGGAGTPIAGGTGEGPAITLAAPANAGVWGLQLGVTFSPERSATWYWQIRVTR